MDDMGGISGTEGFIGSGMGGTGGLPPRGCIIGTIIFGVLLAAAFFTVLHLMMNEV